MVTMEEKTQLIEIEKRERSVGRFELEQALRNKKEKIEEPFDKEIKKLETMMNDEIQKIEEPFNKLIEKEYASKKIALKNEGLLYISEGYTKIHFILKKYDLETNRRIKAILRE